MRIGFIGLGDMGAGMALNLVRAGFEVTVRDLRPGPVSQLTAAGAQAADSNAQTGAGADVACVAVFDAAQTRAAVLGDGPDAGLLAGMRTGGVIVLHPTIGPDQARALGEAAAARGVAVLDAPMTGGGPVAARDGALTFMVGGEADALAKARPALAAMAKAIFHMGPLGAGAAAKIINNFLGTTHTLLVREALRMAHAAGIGEADILALLNAGAVGANWSTANWERIKTQEAGYTTGRAGMVAMASKDLRLAADLSSSFGTATPALDAIVGSALADLARTGLTDRGL